MRNDYKDIRILVKGGIMSPGFFLKIIDIARQNNNTTISFGSRQDILFPVKRNNIQKTTEFLQQNGIDFEWKGDDRNRSQNIVSSFVANDIFPSTNWVNPSAYLYILEGFDYFPKIKINIIDPMQKLVPHFSGHLNFLASTVENYWFLFIRIPAINLFYEWPVLIDSADIPHLAKFIEPFINDPQDLNMEELFEVVRESISLNSIVKKTELKRSPNFPPYYEGMHKMEEGNAFWAGFYWRNNKYSIKFIEQVCHLCLSTTIAKISITPWKSFLIKNIKGSNRLLWEQMIGNFGINMQHSSFELYWHLPYSSESALRLKRYIVSQFDKIDIRTFGLTFSIGTTDIPFTSVIIKEKPFPKLLNKLDILKEYQIYYAEDFDPETNNFIPYFRTVTHRELPSVLIEISKMYYAGLSLLQTITEKPVVAKTNEIEVYECTKCFTIYHQPAGDMINNIAKGTPFDLLPESYCCPTCSADKKHFRATSISKEWV